MNQMIRLSLFLFIPFLAGQVCCLHFVNRPHPSSYKLWTARDIQEKLRLWEDQYPQLIRVTTAQERYGFPRAGSESDCAFEEGQVGCSNYFFTIQDYVAHPEGSRSALILPEVFWSGAMHGNEPIGVTVVMESAALLLEAASCEARPRDVGSDLWSKEVLEAMRCRDQLRKKGVDDQRRRWLARLVSTRRIVVVPALNSLGFDRGEMTEGMYDPEEDFPSINYNETSCMETIAARTMNEIFREHMFQIALLFRSGEQDSIGYSWGSEGFEGFSSPDLKAQASMAAARETILEGNSGSLEIGELNTIGNETTDAGKAVDWAYASSWYRSGLQPCKPTVGRYYSPEKVKYNDSTHRAIALSISTKFDASESADISRLGSTEHLFQEGGQNFLVTRNILMTLASADLVEPYVSILSIGETILDEDLVPLAKRDGRKCQGSRAVVFPKHQGTRLLVEWTAGGGFNFSDVGIWYAKWDDFTARELDCMFQPELDIRSDPRFQKGQLWGNMPSESGTGAFSPYGPSPVAEPFDDANSRPMGPTFKGWLYLNNFAPGDQIVIFASVKVDQDWASPPEETTQVPNEGPQSHLVNARTNTEWNHAIPNGKKVTGRVNWYSSPATIVLSDDETHVGTVPLGDRFDKYGIHSGQLNKTRVVNVDALKSFGRALAVMVILALAAQAFFAYRRSRMARKNHKLTSTSAMGGWEEGSWDNDKGNPRNGSIVQSDWQTSQRDPVDMEEASENVSTQSEPTHSAASYDTRVQNQESLDASTLSAGKAHYRYDGSMFFQDEARDDDDESGGIRFASLDDDEEMINFEDTCAWEKHEVKRNAAFGVDYERDNMLIFKESTKITYAAEKGVMS